MDPSRRFLTFVLLAGVVVLVAAIAIGERAGGKVFVAAQTSGSLETTTVVTPVPQSTGAPDGYGPDWKRTQTLAAAIDPGFPDPRVPPVAPPTPLLETRREAPKPRPAWTPNPKLPIWDQTPPSSSSPSPSPTPTPELDQPSVSPSPSPGTKTDTTPQP